MALPAVVAVVIEEGTLVAVENQISTPL